MKKKMARKTDQGKSEKNNRPGKIWKENWPGNSHFRLNKVNFDAHRLQVIQSSFEQKMTMTMLYYDKTAWPHINFFGQIVLWHDQYGWFCKNANSCSWHFFLRSQQFWHINYALSSHKKRAEKVCVLCLPIWLYIPQ